MKKFLLISLFCIQVSNAQNDHGIGYYKIVFTSDKQSTQKGAFKDELNEIEKQATHLKFELAFDHTTSLFGLVKGLPIDKKSFATKMATSIFGGDKIYFTKLDEGYYIERKRILDKDFQVKKSIDDMNWEVTKEKKVISGYECFKAKGIRHIMDKNFQNNKLDIVAWYCPEVPFNHGPFEAVGLPGMVFQLDLIGHSIILDELIWDTKTKRENPIKGEIISQKEFDSIFKKMVKAKIPGL